jgi:hypothetical protein
MARICEQVQSIPSAERRVYGTPVAPPNGVDLRKNVALDGSTDPASVDRRLASYSATRKQRSLTPPRFLLAFGEQKTGRSVVFYGA